MKRLYIINGTMGVGKTTISKELIKKLPKCVLLDGDWCWYANPFQVNDETKIMVINNICFLLNEFIKCNSYDNIVFCWVMDKQSIIDEILFNLEFKELDIKIITIMCNNDTLEAHLNKDINAGIRSIDIIERSKERIPLYNSFNSIKIYIDNRNIDDITNEIINIGDAYYGE